MPPRLLASILLLSFATIASAHFVFVVPQPGGAGVQAFLSEELKPTGEVDVAIISSVKLTVRDVQGRETPLALTKGSDAYTAVLPAGSRLIFGTADLGAMQRGREKPYHLIYYPKTILGDAFDHTQTVGDKESLEIIPVGKPGALRFKVLAHAAPLPKSEVTVILPDGAQKKLVTDDAGLTEVLAQTGRFGAWARYWEGDVRNYATLVFDVPAGPAMTSQTAPTTLPEASSSFGAVASGGWLYVYGGHVAQTHSYSTDAVSGQFARLNLSDGVTWEKLPSGPALQGMNLAAADDKIYRIGGMAPRNPPGEKEAIYSVADGARFNPATPQWESLPPLPEPRSSHDLVVIGNKLIVTGGWNLKGPGGEQWLDTLQILDLRAPSLGWKTAPQPFKRRALIAAALQGKMYVMGGIDDHGKISHDVSIYDPESGAWTSGPPLPGGEIDGFGPAACVHEGSLFVSLAGGSLYRLNASKSEWEKAGTATPRVAHRLASTRNGILVLGGAAKNRNLDLVEIVTPGN